MNDNRLTKKFMLLSYVHNNIDWISDIKQFFETLGVENKCMCELSLAIREYNDRMGNYYNKLT